MNGAALPRIDGEAKVTGAASFAGDSIPQDALHAIIVFSDQPHARMTAMDTSGAESMPGVHFVLTAADVPVNEYGLTMFDQPVLVGLNDTGASRVPADVSRWEADQIAVIVAESAEQARAAAAAIEVEWEQLPLFDNIDDALATDVLLHPENGAASNAYNPMRIRKGDMEQGWADADVIVEGVYESPHQEHAYLQPEAASAWIDELDRVTIRVAGQWTHEDREQVAHALGIDEERVRIIYPAIGGAFGGREDQSMQIVLALAARRCHSLGLDRPVFCRWSREESIVGHHKRHRVRVTHRLGLTNAGVITAVEAAVDLDAGAYNYTSNKVLGNAHLCAVGPYRSANVHIDSRAIYTTSVPGGAFRGFGAPQGAFAMETQLNKAAALLDIDPVELRQINVLRDGDESATQVPLPDVVTLSQVIAACDERRQLPLPDVANEPMRSTATLPAATDQIRRGRGFAAAFKNIGYSFGFPERSETEIRLHGEGDEPSSAELFQSAAEVGQGVHTAYLQMAAEATGLEVDRVTARWSDTSITGDSGSASASRLTWMGGNSIRGAAEEAEKAWINGDRPAIGRFRFVPPPTDVLDAETGAGQPNFAYGYVAQAIDLSVDIGTGMIRIDRVVSTHDVGRAINPELVRGQIEGGVVQAHGYALTEDLRVADGRITNPRLSSYLIPGIGDVPVFIDAHVLEIPDPRGPWGARGVAEMPMIPYAACVAAALFDATGVWVDGFPFTPSRVLAALNSEH